MSFTIYHNPRCSKSRETLQLLRDKEVEPTIIEYLVAPPTVEELRHIVSLLGIKPRALLRTGEDEYKEAGLDDMSLSDEVILEKMVVYPRVIERPIVIKDGKQAVIGRPPKLVASLL
ncbi:MAG: arsenate reductase (glutaredoxin) [Gammaproteobacteria bacterium]|nr:arsenate reductase (glutaredoxin) [Gammaproteobacteria bacterium]